MITSPNNPKLKLVRRLATRRGREREGLFVTEGEDLVSAGLAGGHRPHAILAVPSYTGPGSELAETIGDGLLEEVSALGSGTRVLAIWPRRLGPVQGPVCLFLDGVGDPGNVGAIIRSHGALLAGSVVLGRGCADPHAPKAVRAAMGSIFGRAPARAAIEETPGPRIGLVAHGGDWPLPVPGGADSVTLCLGAEREGLSTAVLDACDATATIPTRAGGPESLNVAAAAAICCERVSSHPVLSTLDRTRPGGESL